MKVQQVSPGIINKIKSLIARIGYLKSDIGIVEDTDTATHTISSGQYVIWKNELYKASAAIPSGDPLSSTNLTAVSDGIANELNSNINNKSTLISGFSASSEADLTTVINTLNAGTFAFGTFEDLTLTGGAISPVILFRRVASVAFCFIIYTQKVGYYYSSAWHWN